MLESIDEFFNTDKMVSRYVMLLFYLGNVLSLFRKTPVFCQKFFLGAVEPNRSSESRNERAKDEEKEERQRRRRRGKSRVSDDANERSEGDLA